FQLSKYGKCPCSRIWRDVHNVRRDNCIARSLEGTYFGHTSRRPLGHIAGASAPTSQTWRRGTIRDIHIASGIPSRAGRGRARLSQPTARLVSLPALPIVGFRQVPPNWI